VFELGVRLGESGEEIKGRAGGSAGDGSETIEYDGAAIGGTDQTTDGLLPFKSRSMPRQSSYEGD